MPEDGTNRAARGVLTAWGILSALIALSLAAAYAWKGQAGLEVVLVTGPLSNFWLTFMALILAWLLGGLAAWLIAARRLDTGNALSWAGFFVVSFLYLNLLRERVQYGDLDSYILGATNLYNGQPFDSLYIYPPFWAMLLKPLVPLGDKAFLYVLWAANLLGLMAFYWLFHRVLERYGFSARLAALAVTAFMVVNVAVLRTMFYMQVNLHVLNLIFLSLLLYPRARPLSALCLALAVHLKASPLALALAFLLDRDWRWLAWLAFFGFVIFGATLLADGWGPYASYLHNLSLLNAPRGMILRETSFDSFFWSLGQMLGLGEVLPRAAIYLSKALLTAAALFVMARTVRGRTFAQGESANLLNALPPLLVLMNMLSPLVWEHHGVFLGLAAIVLLRALSTPTEWAWFGVFYFVQYLLPTFDFFPWSYARLLTPLLLLWLMGRSATHAPGGPTLFNRIEQWLQTLPSLPARA